MSRLRVTAALFLLSFFAIVFRLYQVQVIDGSAFATKADAQHFDTLNIPAERGDILSFNGESMAGTTPTFLLHAYTPELTIDIPGLVDRLLSVLRPSQEDKSLKDELFAKLTGGSHWNILAQHITSQQKDAIDEWRLPGLGFEGNPTRYYPDASSSAHVMGFVGKDALGREKGYFGLEGYYDRELVGVSGSLEQERDALGNPILVGTYKEIPPLPGRRLVTNIDRYVQHMTESELLSGMERYGAKAGEAVVMDPKTGAIIASASYPNYDPSSYWTFGPNSYKNPAIAETYEPGSTFKILVMAAALDAGVVAPDTRCDSCAGPVRIGKYLIRTWNEQYHPDLSMTETIIHSDNTGMVFVGQKLGSDRLKEYLHRFGIGQKTGVDLQEEVQSPMRMGSTWSDIDLATASFGQGIAVTTLQMLRAVGAIANHGMLMTPQVVHQIQGNQRTTIDPKEAGQVVSLGTAQAVTEMMVRAVDEGEAKFAAPKGYRIAGKTGTAQIPVAGHYDQDKTIASFVGFAPADDPKFVMIVKLREPTSSPWGSETAAPLWFSLAKKLLQYWKIPPGE